MTNEELKTAEDIAKNATSPWTVGILTKEPTMLEDGTVVSTTPNTLSLDKCKIDGKFISHFNPAFCLRLIEEIRRLQNGEVTVTIPQNIEKHISFTVKNESERKVIIKIADPTPEQIQLDSAAEVIMFYGGKGMWGGKDMRLMHLYDCEEDNKYAGKKAREWLKKYEGNK